MPSRRSFITSAAAIAGSACTAYARPPAPATIDVKALGASGDGKQPDLLPIREAIRRAGERQGAVTLFFPPGEYFLGTTDDQYLLNVVGLENIRFVGERATLSCKTVQGQPSMLVLAGCRNITVTGLTFRDYGLNREINWLGAAAVRLVNDGQRGCEKIQIRDCRFESVLAAVVCRSFDPAARTRGLVLSNLTVNRSYYGFSFQDDGDDVVGRRLRCNDVKRSYFPYGVSKHDVELETVNNATGFTDVLIKCYHRNTSGIRARVRCRGKRGGDAIVALDQQHEKGRGVIRDIRLDLDVDDVDRDADAADSRLDTVVLIRSFDPEARVERVTSNRWDNIVLDGTVRIGGTTKLIDIVTVGKKPGRLRIGRRLSRHPRLPRAFPGFVVTTTRP